MAYTILLLEDDIELNSTIKQFLEFKGYSVIASFNGEDAEDLVYENSIDLMLLDVKVPRVSGFDFLKKLRDDDKDIPAIFITSLNSVEDVQKGFMLGCDDYIRKPFALKELEVRIDSILKRVYSSYSDRVLIDENLFFDIKELVLYKNGEKLPLKYKELKLLSLLLKNRDKLLDYETIYQELWDFSEEPNAASLRTYIKNLRKVIGKDKIETIKNIGYQFVSK